MDSKGVSRSVLAFSAFLLIVAVPGILVAFTPFAPMTADVFAGIGVGVVGCLYGIRAGLGAVLASVLLIGVVELVGPHPWAAAVVMAVIGILIGWSARRGWHPVAVQACAWPATLLIAPPFSISGVPWAAESAGQAVLSAGLALAGGLWAVGAVAALGRRLPQLTPVRVDAVSARLYGGALAVVLGAAAFVAAAWFPGSMAGWALLTVLVVVKPGLADTRERILARSAGTVLGGLLAAGLAFAIPVQWGLTAAGGAAMVLALVLYAKASHYAWYASALTAAVVLLSPTSDVLAVDLQRVGFTLVTAVLVSLLSLVYEPIVRALMAKGRAPFERD